MYKCEHREFLDLELQKGQRRCPRLRSWKRFVTQRHQLHQTALQLHVA